MAKKLELYMETVDYDVLNNQEKNTYFSFQLHLHHIKDVTFFCRKVIFLEDKCSQRDYIT